MTLVSCDQTAVLTVLAVVMFTYYQEAQGTKHANKFSFNLLKWKHVWLIKILIATEVMTDSTNKRDDVIYF